MVNGILFHIKYYTDIGNHHFYLQVSDEEKFLKVKEMIKCAIILLALCSLSVSLRLPNLHSLLDIKRSFGDVGLSPTVYRGYGYPTTYVAFNGVPSVPVVPQVPSGYSVGYGANSGYVSPPGYYNPHTGVITGQQAFGNHPVSYSGYGQGYGWRH